MSTKELIMAIIADVISAMITSVLYSLGVYLGAYLFAIIFLLILLYLMYLMKWRPAYCIVNRILRRGISLNATALIISPDRTRMLLVNNPDHKIEKCEAFLPPGGHVSVWKGEVPHEHVIKKIEVETGYRVSHDHLDSNIHEVKGSREIAGFTGGSKILEVTRPYCVLSEAQIASLPCCCKTHYDLFYVFIVDPEHEHPVGNRRPKYTAIWFNLDEIKQLASSNGLVHEGKTFRTYPDVKILAERLLKG